MASKVPNPLWLYRIIHSDNLEYILANGIYVRGHGMHDPAYVNIGNVDIINVRDSFAVKLDGYGKIGEYVPFYFGKQSIMLYNILTGQGVPKINPANIIYICCELESLVSSCKKYFFTDGQANKKFTEHHNDLKKLDEIDWDVILGDDFTKNGDIDRPRKYMAEFLVHEHVPLSCIKKIVVYNDRTKVYVAQLLVKYGVKIKVEAARVGYYFYF